MCEHDNIIVDGSSDKTAVKITICKKCFMVQHVVIRGETTEYKAPSTGDKITRMSVLKAATDVIVSRSTTNPVSDPVAAILRVALELEAWVNR